MMYESLQREILKDKLLKRLKKWTVRSQGKEQASVCHEGGKPHTAFKQTLFTQPFASATLSLMSAQL